MPVYNEASTVCEVIKKVLSQPSVAEIIIVDDCSTDGTPTAVSAYITDTDRESQPEALRTTLRLIQHDRNMGKGAAIRSGIQKANAPLVIVQDADLEYDPEEYERLLKPILSGKADVVFGSRFLGSGAHRILYFWHYVGNKMLTLLSNMCTNLNLSDMETCYKVFKREIIQSVELVENRFGFEPEVTAKVARLNIRLYEVAVSYYGRTYEEGKKINWRDGFSAIRCILKYGLFRR
jgi:glycosyltransferase involved in cell wall biosynthesis